MMNARPVYRYVDLSGYGFSGKHAVIDLVREFAGFQVPHFAYEFALLRIQGGILDLEDALVNHWSPIRSDAAIRRFRRVARRLGTVNSWRRPRSWWNSVGWNYDAVYSGRFLALTEAYVRDLVDAEWVTDWPYPLADLPSPELFVRKLGARLRIPRALDFRVSLAAPDDFVGRTRRYLDEVLSSNAARGTTTIVMHNAFEPFEPVRCLKYFDHVRSIVVDRDPRDTFVQQLTYRPMALPVNEFIRRYRRYRELAARATPHPAVLRIRFEDLVRRYDATVGAIRAHLGVSPDQHTAPCEHFDPAVSARNIGLWRTYARRADIEQIAALLAEYCCDE